VSKRPTLVRFKNEYLNDAVRESAKGLGVSVSDWMSNAAAWILKNGGVGFASQVRSSKSKRGRPVGVKSGKAVAE
jgi:hypothetical protein